MTESSANWDFDQQCGSDTPFEVTVTDPDTGDPIDLTDAFVEWIIAKNDGTRDVNVLYYTTENDKLTIDDPEDGKITGSLLPEDTEGISTTKTPVTCQHQMFLTLDGGEAMLIQQGTIKFIRKLPVPEGP